MTVTYAAKPVKCTKCGAAWATFAESDGHECMDVFHQEALEMRAAEDADAIERVFVKFAGSTAPTYKILAAMQVARGWSDSRMSIAHGLHVQRRLSTVATPAL